VSAVELDLEGVRLPAERGAEVGLELIGQFRGVAFADGLSDDLFRRSADVLERLSAGGRVPQVLVEQRDRAVGEVLDDRPVPALAPLEFPLVLLALGDVDDDAFEYHLAVVDDGASVVSHPPHVAVGGLDAVGHGELLSFLDTSLDLLPEGLAVRLDDDLGAVRHVPALQRLGVVPGQFPRSLADERHRPLALVPAAIDHAGNVVHQRRELSPLLAELSLHLLALAHVPEVHRQPRPGRVGVHLGPDPERFGVALERRRLLRLHRLAETVVELRPRGLGELVPQHLAPEVVR